MEIIVGIIKVAFRLKSGEIIADTCWTHSLPKWFNSSRFIYDSDFIKSFAYAPSEYRTYDHTFLPVESGFIFIDEQTFTILSRNSFFTPGIIKGKVALNAFTNKDIDLSYQEWEKLISEKRITQNKEIIDNYQDILPDDCVEIDMDPWNIINFGFGDTEKSKLRHKICNMGINLSRMWKPIF